MKNFKDFGIKVQSKNFEGEKISIKRILNKKVIIDDYKIENSKFDKGSGKCLWMQITVEGNKRVVFTGSTFLMQVIEQIPKSDFPFETTIEEDNGGFKFT